ncbi:ABC transporter ATP-binding protein [Convivina intestini]|uniref:ABC transporter ATP-binding protein n=1 Tax=Convivina intestini TaxID=1505726 RepID=UPI00200F3BA1|nr:ABC transporter ATP-binding protein [Convivina intestini]CAH1857075.1 Multidrug resistance ABC transporter ATP-binding/permease protein BmrA [Convivina intestini]
MTKIYRLVSNKIIFITGIVVLLISTAINVYIPLIVRDVFNRFTNNENFLASVYLLALCLTLNVVILTLGNTILEVVGEKSIRRLRLKLITHINKLQISASEKYDQVNISSHIINDSEMLGRLVSATLPSIVTSAAAWLGALIMLFVIDWRMSLVILVGALTIALIIKIIGAKLALTAKEFRAELAILNSKLANFLKFQLEIRLSNASNWFLGKNIHENDLLYRTSLKGVKYRVILAPIINGILMALLIVVAGIGLYEIKMGLINVGILVSFIMYLYQLITPTLTLSSAVSDFASENGSLNKVIKLDEEFDSHRSLDNEGLLVQIPQEIVFDKVSISYNGDAILQNVNFTVRKGEIAVLKGPSGVGKTSILKVLFKVLACQSGAVLIDQINLNQINLTNWYEHIDYVGQEPFIVDGLSIAENLRLGQHYSKTAMKKVLQEVGLWEEIADQGGLNYHLQTQGNLSGGQIQRLCIARALLQGHDILVLDEVTSALDEANEQKILKLLDQLKDNRIILQISHRPQVINHADNIIDVQSFKA